MPFMSSSKTSSYGSFNPIADVQLPIRLAQCVGITTVSALAGANLGFSFILVPRLLESPPHLLLKQWNNAYSQGKVLFPTGVLLSAGSFFFVAYKQTEKLKLKSYAAAGILSLAIVPYTLLAMSYTNNKLFGKVEESQGMVYPDGYDDSASAGSGRKHKSSKSSKSDRSSKKSSSSSSRKRSGREEEEEVDERTAHELVDRWGVLNLGRSLLLIASGAVGAWTAIR